MKNVVIRLKFHSSLFLWDQLIITSTGLHNGLAPNNGQYIIWTYAGSIHWRVYAALYISTYIILLMFYFYVVVLNTLWAEQNGQYFVHIFKKYGSGNWSAPNWATNHCLNQWRSSLSSYCGTGHIEVTKHHQRKVRILTIHYLNLCWFNSLTRICSTIYQHLYHFLDVLFLCRST